MAAKEIVIIGSATILPVMRKAGAAIEKTRPLQYEAALTRIFLVREMGVAAIILRDHPHKTHGKNRNNKSLQL